MTIRMPKGRMYIKASDSDMLKTVTSLRKSLIDANSQAMLAVDNLESIAMFNPEEAIGADNGSTNYDAAINACNGISACISKAIEFSEEMKKALAPTKLSSMMSDEEVASKALKRRRQLVRLKKYYRGR